jgi:hypothetical protein
MKELLLSNGRVLGGKRVKRGTRLAKIPHTVHDVFVVFFFKFPAPIPLKITFLLPLCLCLFFWALIFLAL